MGLLEELKLVANFMEYDFIDYLHIKDKNGNWIVDGRHWNPKNTREWWDEIWDKMDEITFDKYLKILKGLFPTNISEQWTDYHFHTAKPEACWKSLVKTLVEG